MHFNEKEKQILKNTLKHFIVPILDLKKIYEISQLNYYMNTYFIKSIINSNDTKM